MRFLLLALLAPLAATPSPVPKASPDAKALLSRAAALYGDGAAHAASFVQVYKPAGFTSARRESGTLWIQTPQRLRFDYAAPEKKTFTYDAGEGRLFAPEDRQLTVRRLSAEERARLPIVFLSDPAELARQYEITLQGSQASGGLVVLTPRAARQDLAWLKLSIRGDGSVEALSYADSAGSLSEFRFEGWRREKARPDADYRVAGPPGTRVLEN